MKDLGTSLNMLFIFGLAAQALLFGLLVFFLYFRLRSTHRLIRTFRHDFSSAESNHRTLVDEARGRLAELSPAIAPAKQFAITPKRGALSSEIRNQIAALGKKGFTIADIARTCSIPESDIGVLLGFARLQK